MIDCFWDVGKMQSYEYIAHAEIYLGLYQTSMMIFFCENSDQKPLTIFLKGSIIDMWKGYVSYTMYSFSEIFEDIEENRAIKIK